MDLSALQVFVDVIRRGSFAAVARDRRSAPSSISRTIVADETEQVTGRLRITAPVTFGQVALVPLLPELARLHPTLSFDLLLTDAAIDLAAERVDVALRLGTLDDSSLVATGLFAMRYVVCASPTYLAAAGTHRIAAGARPPPETGARPVARRTIRAASKDGRPESPARTFTRSPSAKSTRTRSANSPPSTACLHPRRGATRS